MTQIMPMVGVMFSYFFMCGLLLANRSGDGMSVLEQTPHTAVSDGSDIGTSSRERFSQDLPVRSPQSRARCLF